MSHNDRSGVTLTRLGRAVRTAGGAAAPAEPQHREEHRQANWLRDVILGGQDGLVNILGIILGVIAGGGSNAVLLAAGFAGLGVNGQGQPAASLVQKFQLGEVAELCHLGHRASGCGPVASSTSTSIGPNRLVIGATRSATCASSVTSAPKASPPPRMLWR